jgi:predicted Rossmann-fold nucleotide-binding protein
VKKIKTVKELKAILDAGKSIAGALLFGIDLADVAAEIKRVDIENCIFFGCVIPAELLTSLEQGGALILPRIRNLPYEPYRSDLYGPEELYAGINTDDPQSYIDTVDGKIYQHWDRNGRTEPSFPSEALSQRLHDQSINQAMLEFLSTVTSDKRGVVALMGGHDLKRSSEEFSNIAILAHRLVRAGFFMVTGGKVGAMEATHMGAWFAARSEAELTTAIKQLSQEADDFEDPRWLVSAIKLKSEYEPVDERSHWSLGIPTWVYFQEPATPFATHIAKYFANSLREEGLVRVGTAGVIFARGSAGTCQEIFEDLTQNHYMTHNIASAMIFMDKTYWEQTLPVVHLVQTIAKGRPYQALITALDDIDEIVQFLLDHPPINGSGGHALAFMPQDLVPKIASRHLSIAMKH